MLATVAQHAVAAEPLEAAAVETLQAADEGNIVSVPAAGALAAAIAVSGTLFERVFVWAHALTMLGFLAYLPYSKHLHIFTAAVNVFFGRTKARGRLEPLRFDLPDDVSLNCLAAAEGSLFVGTDKGIFRSTNRGQNW